MNDNSYSTGDTSSDDANVHVAPGGTDSENVRELATIPAVEVTTRAAIMLMSAAAEKIGPDAGGDEEFKDLPDARALINALAGLVTAAAPDLGLHRKPIQDGLKALQLAFREASSYPDAPGEGPGEKYTGPVKG
ncbi:DUF1844 domain-containing protein [Gordonia neofelifaecis]|uniref:RecA/RadA recombinase n=1 Tax=Gordonia neofelifaecis NRRL B-59395 TaxID=644548 RepID=F1YH83_9ACTN|nr:DUF1844 domain-containing protein [Gordonia neofelifaecis]EGD55998.1 hypothetical protein SCNU_07150 [Gordonia neofelifaecis NRRL B-59395]